MDRIKGMLEGQLPDEVQAMFPDGLPDVSQLNSVISTLSEDDISARASESLQGVDQAKLTSFGSMLSDFSAKQGKQAPAGLGQGNASDIASVMAASLKSEGGLKGTMQMVQDAAGGGGMLDSVMDSITGGNSDLIGLLKNPQVMAVLGPIIAGLVKQK